MTIRGEHTQDDQLAPARGHKRERKAVVYCGEPVGWAIRRETHDWLIVLPILRETRAMFHLGYYQRHFGDKRWMFRKHYRYEVLARFETKQEADDQIAEFMVIRDSFNAEARELREQMDAVIERRRLAINAAAKQIKDRWGVSA